jgi:hypothetical protein
MGELVNPHCRIGKVTRKGGATVRVLRPEDDGSSGKLIATLREHVDILADQFKDDAAGFAVVVWGRDGRTNRGSRNAPSSPYSQRLLPAIVYDVLAQDTMAIVTRDVLDGKV